MSRRLFDTTRFTDRVMAEITGQPTPTPARTLGSAVRTRDPGKGLGAMWSAWHLATVRSSVRFSVRARSAALVAAVALLMAMGVSITAAGAGTVVRLATDGRFQPTWFLQGDSYDRAEPAVTPRVTPSAEPSGDTHELRDGQPGVDGDPDDNLLAPTPTADEQGQDDGQDQDEQQPAESAAPDPSQSNDGQGGGGSQGGDEDGNDGQGGGGGGGGGGDGQ